nr:MULTISPECIES: hypothetical protein [unclassified Bradyrhizobium]
MMPCPPTRDFGGDACSRRLAFLCARARRIFLAWPIRHQTIKRHFQSVRHLAQRLNVAAFAPDLDLGQIALRDARAFGEIILTQAAFFYGRMRAAFSQQCFCEIGRPPLA